MKVVETIESSDSHAFVRILQDAVPQMVSSMKQNIDTSLGNFEKILQDALQAFSKKNEQSPKQHVTVSKPDVALEESGNSTKIAPSAPVIDERYIPLHRRDEVGLNNKSFAPNGLNGQNGNSNNSNINKPN